MRRALAIAIVVTAAPAEAKYDPCGMTSVLIPSGRVARNAKVWVWRGYGEDVQLRGDGATRHLGARTRGGLAMLDPGPLPARTTLDLALGPWKIGELVTGDGVDRVPPERPRFDGLAIAQVEDPELAPPVADLAFEVAPPAFDLALDLALPDDTVAVELAFDDREGRILLPPAQLAVFGRNACGPQRSFTIGAPICMTVRALDLAGNASAPATACTTVRGVLGDPRRDPIPHRWTRPAPQRPQRGPWLVLVLALAVVAPFAAWRLSRGPDPV